MLFACPTLGQIKLAGMGTWRGGSVFAINSDGSMPEQWKEFEIPPGSPTGNLVAANGKLWGITSEGGTERIGTIFRMDSDGSNFSIVHHFDGINGAMSVDDTRGGEATPVGSLVLAEGKLWGTTSRGGANEAGIIFTINPGDDSFTKVHDFKSTNGANPRGSLVFAEDKLWGVTEKGGENSDGTIFTIDPADNSFTKAHDFKNAPFGEEKNGASPAGSLVFAEEKLWGVTERGGSSGFRSSGIIFSIDPDDDTF
ncbi:MAG: hypothetical protein GDA42_08555 [Ekhidna sp.]|nr:hypothetical protein [Ekhidna sp.]